MRERVHSKVLLDKSKFERELKRLECSINYEGGKKQKSGTQERGTRCWKFNEVKVAKLERAGS